MARFLLCYLSFLFIAASAAAESEQPATPGPIFSKWDKNGDGKLSRDEVPSQAGFAAYDADGDGFVTPQELSSRRVTVSRARLRQAMEAAGIQVHHDIRYTETEGVEAIRQSLDLYTHPDLKDAPVLLFFHGGGWRQGDKSAALNKPLGFVPEGYVVVSANYRFRPAATMDELMADCAAAVKWITEHIETYGGDKTRIVLMGHSAGAHLAALLAADSRYLKAAEVDPAIIRAAIPLDMGFYDVTTAAETAVNDARKQMVETVFGTDPEGWAKVSPLTYVKPEAKLPPYFVVMQDSRGDAERQAVPFVEALKAVGIEATLYEAKGRNHATVNQLLGTKDDPTTLEILEFLKKP